MRLERLFKAVELLGNQAAGVRLVVSVAPKGMSIAEAQAEVDAIARDVRHWTGVEKKTVN